MTPDVNVLLAASRTDHPHYARAVAWLEAARSACVTGQPLVILPMVAAGFLRLATHPRVFTQPTPLPAAMEFLTAVLGSPGVEMLPLGPEWPMFVRLCAEHELAGNDIPDAWVAAAVRTSHEHLVTFDRGFRRFLSTRELTILAPGKS